MAEAHISREDFERLEAEIHALGEELSEKNLNRTARMAWGQAMHDFDSERGVRLIKQHAKERGISFEEAMLELSEQLPAEVPTYRAPVTLSDEALDKEIRYLAREKKITYAEAAALLAEGQTGDADTLLEDELESELGAVDPRLLEPEATVDLDEDRLHQKIEQLALAEHLTYEEAAIRVMEGA